MKISGKFIILFNMNRKQVFTFDSESVSVIGKFHIRNVFQVKIRNRILYIKILVLVE